MYKNSNRSGELTTTGLSNNFIIDLDLKTDIDSDIWIKRGVACICENDF